MTKDLIPAQEHAGLLDRMAFDAGVSKTNYLSTLKATIFPSGGRAASNEEVMALLFVADKYGLNPWLKQIYAFPAKGGGITPIMGYDGWVQLMQSNPAHDGIDTSKYAEDNSWYEVTIHRKDQKVPTTVREYLDECKRNTDPWRTSPRRMLRNRAVCQAVRLAYGVAGVMLEDEAEAVRERETGATVVRSKTAHPVLQAIAPTPEPEEEEETAPEKEETYEEAAKRMIQERGTALFDDDGPETDYDNQD